MFTTISQYIWGDIEDNGKIREKEGDWVMVDNDKPICWSSSVSHQIICPSYPLTSSSLVHQVEKNNLSDYIECEQFPSLSSHSTTKFTDSVFTTVVLHSKLAERLSSQSSSVSHQVHHSNRSKDVDCLRTSSFLNENSKKPFQKLQSSLSLCYTSPLSICYNKDISLQSPLPICFTAPLSICYKDNISTNKFIPCKSALSPAFTTNISSTDTSHVRIKYEPRREATSPTYMLGSMPVTTFLSSPKKYINKLQRRKTSVIGKPMSRYAIANIKMYYNNVKLCI